MTDSETPMPPPRPPQLGSNGSERSAPNSTRWTAVGIAAFTVALGVLFALQVGNDPSLASGKLLGQSAPTFSGVDLAGEQVSSSDLAGSIVFVNFWNDWCLPCREETPALVAFWNAHRNDEDFTMVGIVRDMRSERDLRDYAFDNSMTWPIIFDPDGRAAVDFSTTGQPESFMIAADGTVVGFQAGAAQLDDLELMLAAARGMDVR